MAIANTPYITIDKLIKKGNTMNNMKIRITDAAHSELVQKELFKQGVSWNGAGNLNSVNYKQMPCLYIDGGKITCGEDKDYFNKHRLPEYKANIVQSITFSLVEKEVIIVDGKKYYKEDIQKAIAGIKEAV